MAKPKKSTKKGPKTKKPAAPKGKARAVVRPAPKARATSKHPPRKPLAKTTPGVGDSADLTLARLSARWPALSELEIEAFSSLATDAQCDDLGRRTKATEVRDEAVRWSMVIDGALKSFPGALAAYSTKRFAFVLHQARALTAIIAAEDARRGRVTGARTSADDARATAMQARAATLERLTTFAGIRAVERAAISEALGQPETVDGLARSLRALSHLESAWIERTDPASRVLADNAGLSAENAETLRAHAENLGTKKVEAALQGPAQARDTPLMNRIEGRILFELREARRIFNAAHERNSVIPALHPSAALRGTLGRSTQVAAPRPAPPPDDDPEPAPLTQPDGAPPPP
jgi:hypothetical protein